MANFHVILQLGIKALDAADRIRRASSDGRKSINGKTVGVHCQSKQFEAEELYSSAVAELCLRVVTICVFTRYRMGATVQGKESNQDLIPTTTSMESYVKRLRLARRKGNADDWHVSKMHRKSSSFDDASDDLMGLATPDLSPERRLINSSDTLMTEASEFVEDSDLVYMYPVRGKNGDTPSTPHNRKRQGNSANIWRENGIINAMDNSSALSPSSSNLTNPKSTSSPSFLLIHKRVQKSLSSDDYSLCTDNFNQFVHDNVDKDEDMKSAVADFEGMACLRRKTALHPFSFSLAPRQRWDAGQDLESTLIADEISDIMMRICFQLDVLASRTPNYYGIFNMQPLTSELNMLKRRLVACLDFVMTGKGESANSHKEPFQISRNAPMAGEDFDRSGDTVQAGISSRHPVKLARSTVLRDLPFRDITGRIFWEDHCCDGEAVSSHVPWVRFAEAFESVYGVQNQSVMDRFREALDSETPKKSAEAYTCRGTEERDKVGISRNMLRTSPRKKRRSHVSRWFRKSIMICPQLSTAEQSCACEKCSDFPEDPDHSSGLPNEASSCTISIENFAKFCMDYGGLFEGFITVTDPGTQIECFGTVEDLSKEELHNLGLFEETEDMVSDIEAEERSVVFKPYIIKELLGLQILQLSCGGQHAAILAEGGEVYTVNNGKVCTFCIGLTYAYILTLTRSSNFSLLLISGERADLEDLGMETPGLVLTHAKLLLLIDAPR